MKRKRPIYRKALLKIKNINKPIELILSENDTDSWKNLNFYKTNFIRFSSSPSSILELNLDYLENWVLTEQKVPISEWNDQTTLFIKYMKENNLPIPKDSFNFEFDYPVSFVIFDDGKKPISSDMSNYINLEYLISKDIGVESYLSNQNHWVATKSHYSRIILTEFSKLNY